MYSDEKTSENFNKIANKIVFLLTIIILTFVCLVMVLNAQNTKENAYQLDELYPKTTVVSYVCYEFDTVYVEDFNGVIWKFFGTEDWCEGDVCTLLMKNNNTIDIYDDEIVDVHYDGWVE